MDKIREFWKYKINPITGWRNEKKKKIQPILDVGFKEKDQATYFKPRGFH